MNVETTHWGRNCRNAMGLTGGYLEEILDHLEGTEDGERIGASRNTRWESWDCFEQKARGTLPMWLTNG